MKIPFHLQEVQDDVELIFVSSDRSHDDMISYMKESHGDWLAAQHGSEAAQNLKKEFNVTGIPYLVVLKSDGTLVTKEGRNAVTSQGPAVVQQWKK